MESVGAVVSATAGAIDVVHEFLSPAYAIFSSLVGQPFWHYCLSKQEEEICEFVAKAGVVAGYLLFCGFLVNMLVSVYILASGKSLGSEKKFWKGGRVPFTAKKKKTKKA